MSQANVNETLKELGIELPAVSAPAAAYVMSVQTGNTVYLSGHIALECWRHSLAATADRSKIIVFRLD